MRISMGCALYIPMRVFLAVLTLLVFVLLAGEAHADRTITRVRLDGNTSVTVGPNAQISAAVRVVTTTTGDQYTNDWQSTGWLISTTPPGPVTCENHANHDSSGTYNETFNIQAPSVPGTYNAYFIAYNNSFCSSAPSVLFTLTNAVTVLAPPAVTSINRASTDPTSGGKAVSWTVVFNRSVTGVDTADFALVQSGGVSGATITSVTGSGTTWTVTANTGSGSGTLGLNLIDNDSIRDSAGMELGGLGNNNGNFVGQVYTLAPVVTTINRASTNPTSVGATVSWTVVFTASVTGVNAADFALVEAGGVSGAAISAVTGSGTTWTVTANAGSGSGTLGLNLVDDDSISDAGGRKLGGTGNGNGNFIGQVYTVSPAFCSPPANAPSGMSLTCVCDTFGRTSLNPSTIFGANWIVSTSDSTGIVPSIVNPGYLRLTNNTGNNAKAVTVPGIFPAAGNYISVEFQHYAYNGSGADGIAVTLSDHSVTAVPGAFGGSLGYAPKTPPAVAANIPGFAGGWIGVALDEFGNFQNPTEGRVGGPGAISQSVGVRGSGAGVTGYRWLAGTNQLNPIIDNRGSTSPSRGFYYQVIVDARNEPVNTAVAVNRNTGAGYASLITIPNVYAAATAQGFSQAPVPNHWQISFTGSTGGSANIHEISGLRICAQNVQPPSGGTASGFSVIDEAYGTPPSSPPVQSFLNGHIFTKLQGVPFKLNVGVLSNNQIQTAYVPSGSKPVSLKLVDNADGVCVLDDTKPNYCSSACTGKPAVAGGSKTLSFVPGDAGKKLSTDFTLNTAYRNLVAIVGDSTTTACSIDAFSVRPTSVASVATNATGTQPSDTPVFKAGSAPFSVTATTAGVTGSPGGYTGVLKINRNAIEAISPATELGVLAPMTFPAATSATGSSSATGATFTYNEVGAFRFLGYDPATNASAARGIFDGVAASECNTLQVNQCDVLKSATWTGVDSISTKSDCVADNYSNIRDASGKYGCNFGIASPTTAGRFIPHHFALSSTLLSNRADLPTCTSTFTYFNEPLQVKFTLIAQAADGTATKNYKGAFAKLDPTIFAKLNMGAVDRTTVLPAPTPPYLLTPRITTAGLLAISCGTSPCFVNGLADSITVPFKFTRNASPDGAYSAVDVGINPVDADGVTVPFDIDVTSASAPLNFDSGKLGRTELRHGRMRIDNAYGSELLNLPVQVEAQYWNGSAYVRNAGDNCTPLASSNFSLSNHSVGAGGITSANMSNGNIVGGPALNNGAGKIILNAPTPRPTRKGSVDLSSTIPYLPGVGRETFGLFKAGRVIYIRELY